MPKPKPFNTEKDIIEGKAVANAPIVGGEFVTEDGDWQGQTVQVQSDKHLEDDLGIGEATVLRTYGFAVNPEQFAIKTPTTQELFDDHKKGISALLWQDGLVPREDVEPRVFLSRDKKLYYITVAAIPQIGQSILENTQTLSQIVNAGKSNPN